MLARQLLVRAGARTRRRAAAIPVHALRPNAPRCRSKFTLASPRVAQAASTFGNVLIIGSVLSLFGFIGYTLYDNLLSSHGVTRIYNQSLDLVRAHPQIRELFGPSAKGFGEPTHSQRQRQRSISHRAFQDEQNRSRMYVQYYLEKDGLRGVVKVDLMETLSGWNFNYVVVDLFKDEFLGRVEVLVTDEFKRDVRVQEKERRSRRFEVQDRGTDGSWFSVLNPANWRK
ncbi:mitochondrial import inner membrane translocase subunit tim21 [Coemansia sp. RSA 2706]|nr:mitochondrial import inner membrane translocase subunit tim21 [Coemansia sp. RSA 2708]KAJ2302748.1 mitochondrial import inner membrane translocase subunit tim21 [Coemansia sp. RSA 2706]